VIVIVIVIERLSSAEHEHEHEHEHDYRKSVRLDPLDMSADLAQFFVEMLVAAIDVIDAAHFRPAFRFQPGQNESG
jgi:hypothetical protein